MALDIPGPAVMILNLVGLPWPGVDEDQLRAWAASVRQFADDMCDNSSHVNQTMRELADTSRSAVIGSAADFWETHHQLLVDLHGPLHAFAGALDLAADEVVAQKWAVIGAAGAMATEFAVTQAGAFFTFGADEAALPAELALTRQAVKEALEKLTNALIGSLLQVGMQDAVDHLNGTLGSILNAKFEVQMEVHSLKILYKTLQDAVQSIRRIASAITEIGARAHSQNANRDLTDSSGGGGWNAIINVLKEGLEDFARDLFTSLPRMIVQNLGTLLFSLSKLADNVKAADSEGSLGVSRGESPTAPATGGTHDAEPEPPGTGGRMPTRAGTDGVYDRIEATQDPRATGSTLPKSFNLTTESAGKVWVNPNGTKHMWEETRGLSFGRPLSERIRLESLVDAVDSATTDGIPAWGKMVVSKNWELIFSKPREEGLNPVLKHARWLG